VQSVNDTIAAISTPFGEGALAVLRISGPQAKPIAGAVFSGRHRVDSWPAREAQFGAIHDHGARLDEVLLTFFPGPASFTGEDVVEISCHGGILVTRRILDLLLRCGARAAEPGEFTQRAFMNGKMDLTQAEAVMDLIAAQTDLALRAAREQLEGHLGERVRSLRTNLLELLAHIEAYIDFPDEDIDPDTGSALAARMDSVEAEMARLLSTADRGRVIREGVRTVIHGAPNVGKSSLLNRLLGFERAIVSARPGTTRDVIEEVINLRGIPLRLADTAGIRESSDEIEQAGIERTWRAIEKADLVLLVCDATGVNDFDPRPDAPLIRVLNKCDLGEADHWRNVEAVRISCATGVGLDELAARIEEVVLGSGAAGQDWTVAINARHQACLERAANDLGAANRALAAGTHAEFIAEDLRAALNAVGEIVGQADVEDLLGAIFGRFCIGK
jgi:tRNA modification GTPase